MIIVFSRDVRSPVWLHQLRQVSCQPRTSPLNRTKPLDLQRFRRSLHRRRQTRSGDRVADE